MDGLYFEEVGVGVAIVRLDESAGSGIPVVSLIFPKDFPVYPDDPEHEDNFDDVFLSISAAKTLLIDLRDAVEAAISGKAFE